MNIPEDLKYTEDHEWIKVENGHAIVGITDFAQGELGDIVFVEFEENDGEVAKGDVFGTVEAVKTVSDLFMPVSGTIVEVNEQLESQPEIINSDPYGEGWMIKIQMSNESEIEGLVGASDYTTLTGS